MPTREIESDKRRYTRYPVKEGVIAVVNADASKNVCVIKDVSSGGLGFSYVDLGRSFTPYLGTGAKLKNGDFRFQETPCRIIWDSEDRDNRSFFHTVQMRRGGVEFEELSPELQAKVEELVNTFGLHPETI